MGNTLIEDVATLQADRSRKAAIAWQALIAGLAKGQKPAPAKVLETLEAAGKSLPDLEAAVKKMEKRIAMNAAIAAAAAMAPELPEIDRRREAAAQIYQKAEDQFHAIVRPLNDRANQIRGMTEAAENAKQQLAADCPYVELVEARVAAEQAVRELHAERRELQKLIASGEAGQAEIDSAKRLLSPAAQAEARKNGQARLDALADVRHRLADVDRDLVNANKKVEQAIEATLAP